MKSKNIHLLGYGPSLNLGDEVQTLASQNVLSKLGHKFGGLVDRDEPRPKRGITLLVNGYILLDSVLKLAQYKNIKPIFSNLHIPDHFAKLSSENVAKLAPHQPIGCRDESTEWKLSNSGLDAFFNYCPTLTFDRRKKTPRKFRVFLVDIDPVFKLPKEFDKHEKVYLSQFCLNYKYKTKMAMAQDTLDMYREQAGLVITGRLHCALPCVAMGIPVIFLFGGKEPERIQLAKKVLPIYRYYSSKRYKRLDLLYIRWATVDVMSGLLWKTINSRMMQEIDWQPKAPDIEDIKENIIKKIGEQIKQQA